VKIREDLGPLRRRSTLVVIIVLAALGVIHMRLAQLQLVSGKEWRQLAENNRLRRLPLEAPRGHLYDRRGLVLAHNLPTWDVLLFPDEARDLRRTTLFLARIGITDRAAFDERIVTHRWGPLAPVVIGEGLSWDQVARVRAHQSDYPELSVVSRFRRHYPFSDLTAHAVGHLRLATREDLARRESLRPDSLIGASGVEAQWDEALSGSGGERWIVVSAVGQQLGVVREQSAGAGEDMSLTLDVELQKAAAEALGDHAGAVVVLDPRSGAVRALLSAPSFDPEVFVGRLSRTDWNALRNDPQHPLQNRSIQGVYPPGSTVKPFLALGALSDQLISPAWGVTCRGSIVLHGHPFRCWRRSGHGFVALEKSLEVSCDTYYYLLGRRLSIHGIARWLGHFGFGQPTGIGLPTEAHGLVGTPEWSRRERNQPWYPGITVSVSIGQGPVLATTMQLARAYAALANGGQLIVPHLLESDRRLRPRDLGIDANHLKMIQRGLARAVHGLDATAPSLARLPIAGKTGTAQVARLQEGVEIEDMAPHLRHHAWFVGWAPLEEPRIVVAVLVEHGGGGGTVAAPVARRIFEAALDLEG